MILEVKSRRRHNKPPPPQTSGQRLEQIFRFVSHPIGAVVDKHFFPDKLFSKFYKSLIFRAKSGTLKKTVLCFFL